jgi:hypothetical protein
MVVLNRKTLQVLYQLAVQGSIRMTGIGAMSSAPIAAANTNTAVAGCAGYALVPYPERLAVDWHARRPGRPRFCG